VTCHFRSVTFHSHILHHVVTFRYSPNLKQLIASMLREDPDQRPELAEFLQLPFLAAFVSKHRAIVASYLSSSDAAAGVPRDQESPSADAQAFPAASAASEHDLGAHAYYFPQPPVELVSQQQQCRPLSQHAESPERRHQLKPLAPAGVGGAAPYDTWLVASLEESDCA
jgi:hypothetical protein